MTRTLTTLAAAATLAVATIAAPTPADAGGGRIAAGVIGGLFAGAIIGSALASPYYYGGYGPGPYYSGGYHGPGPYYYGGPYYAAAGGYPCGWRRERVWTGYGWAIRRVRVCY
jgi:hypothetical protein